MEYYFLLFIFWIVSYVAGFAMGVSSIMLGARISRKIQHRSQQEVSSPRGEAFTIQTDDNTAFPEDDEPNKAEEHILSKTAKFLDKFGGSK